MNLKQVTEMLVQEEGEVLHAYRDHLGFLTIGVGRLIDPRKGGGISREESRLLLANDIRKCEEVAVFYPWFEKLDDARQAVIISMIFQLGAGGFHAFRNTIAAIAQGRYDDAARGMMMSKWHQQTPSRVRRLANIMRTGIWTYKEE